MGKGHELNGYGNSLAANRRILRDRFVGELEKCFPTAIAESLARSIENYVIVRTEMPRSKEEVDVLHVVAWPEGAKDE